MGRKTNMSALMYAQHLKIVRFLQDKAQDLITKAQTHKESGDITGTQLDSYGALIFYNGSILYTIIPTHKDLTRQRYGISAVQEEGEDKHKGWNGIPDGTGVEWARMLREEIKSGEWGDIPKQGYCLVVFNAAFYSNPQEKGYGSHPQGWKILSMLVSDLQDIQKKFKGSTLRGHNISIG